MKREMKGAGCIAMCLVLFTLWINASIDSAQMFLCQAQKKLKFSWEHGERECKRAVEPKWASTGERAVG